MDNIKNTLDSEKMDISSKLDIFMFNVKKIINEKNQKISQLSSNIKPKVIVFSDIKLLKTIRDNNKIFRNLLNNFIKISKKKNIPSNDINNMTAFKVIAIELEEKEKIIKNNENYIVECKNNLSNLEKKVFTLNEENDNLKKEIELLSNKNSDLIKLNSLQLQTIDNLKSELDSKLKNVNDLKSYFIDILNKYNDIIVEVY